MTDRLGLKNGLLKLSAYALGLVGVVVGGVLALFFAATVVVMAVIATALIGATMLVTRARRTARVHTGPGGVIDARRVGHTWVAYGWNEPRR
ncbi:MAG TPA: hypothetical protein VF699_11005 [Caulobacteraceae bacterium]|jgi:hypothetical protein